MPSAMMTDPNHGGWRLTWRECHRRRMSKTKQDIPDLLVRWADLEAAWRMLAAPDKMHQIDETVLAMQALCRAGSPEKAVFTMIAATAWLTEDGADD